MTHEALNRSREVDPTWTLGGNLYFFEARKHSGKRQKLLWKSPAGVAVLS
jgi:hypothetical protein